MSVTLQVKNIEDLKLEEGHILGLKFSQGWIFFRILGKEESNLRPWSLGGVSALGNLSDWDEVKDSSNRHYLEPHKEDYIKQFFWGVSPPNARIFLQHTTRQNRWSLIAVERAITGDIGYVDGNPPHGSPWDGPFHPRTEGFSVKDIYPAFQAYNPTNSRMLAITLNFSIVTYAYRIIKDKTRIKEFIAGQRKSKLHVIGGIDPSPPAAPDWLVKRYGEGLFNYASKADEEAET